MRAFKFRLDSYLKLKEHEEKTAWNEVLKQQSRVLKIEKQMDNINEAISNGRQMLSAVGVEVQYNMGAAQVAEESIHALSIKMDILNKERELELKTLETLKQKFFEKKKDAKTMNNLKERKKADFKIKHSKDEQIKIEEMTSKMLLSRKRNNE